MLAASVTSIKPDKRQCDCGATTEGEWAGIHGPGCASLPTAKEEIADAADFLERSARRLLNIAKLDAPPVLIEREAEFILRRITEIRAAVTKIG